MMLVILLIAVACVAYANGANDNFKGVATLFGSGTANYRRALLWATLTTFLGSITAVFLAGTLLKNFTGKGLVDEALVSSVAYGSAVALGAGMTVLLATRIGMPISTTHSLVGALAGAGWAAGSAVDLGQLAGTFFLPLLLSPVLALGMTVVLYPIFHFGRRRMGISRQTCFCVGAETIEAVPALEGTLALERVEQLSARMGTTVECRNRYAGRMLGLQACVVLDRMHYLSAGIVSFARGLNDTPKIAALLLIAPVLNRAGSIALIGGVIALGGLLSARKVAETMSRKITPMNHGQGFTANLVTGLVVIGASRFGLPVSTTHVSCGSLFGIGTLSGEARPDMIGKILAAWMTTLPLGAALGAIGYWFITRL